MKTHLSLHLLTLARNKPHQTTTLWAWLDNIPGKPKTFIPYPAGLPQYREICNKVQKKMYKGFYISLK